jgi:sporulation protein YlmC with PRC-barrel domain
VDIAIGANVIGTDGKLGEISDVVAEARTDQVIEIVVRHRVLLEHAHTVVPLTLVQRVEGGDVYVNLDRATFEKGSEFLSTLHASYTDYVGPPSHDNEGTFRGNMEFDVATLSGGHMQGKPMGYPGGEALTPDDMEEFKIGPGSAVIAADGTKVGELGEFSFARETGERTHLSVRTGHLLKHNTEIPVSWVRDLSTHGVILKVTADQVEALIKRQQHESS